MFRFFDFLFREEKTSDTSGAELGVRESAWLQMSVTQSESEKEIYYSEEEVNQAIIHTRHDMVLLFAQLNRTNIILRWIRFLLIVLIAVLWMKL